jgi:hypothetical protein
VPCTRELWVVSARDLIIEPWLPPSCTQERSTTMNEDNNRTTHVPSGQRSRRVAVTRRVMHDRPTQSTWLGSCLAEGEQPC